MRFLGALGYSVEEALVELWRNRLVNLVSIGTIAVSLFIFGVFVSVTMSLNQLVSGWATRVQLTLYLSDGSSESQRETIDGSLESATEVESFAFVSKDEAVERFRSYFPELEALPDLLGVLLELDAQLRLGLDHVQGRQGGGRGAGRDRRAEDQ